MRGGRVIGPFLVVAMCLISAAVFLRDAETRSNNLRNFPPPSPKQQLHFGDDMHLIRVAIFCLERSGSTWLTAMLNENPGVKIVAEPLARMRTLNGAAAELVAIREELETLEQSFIADGRTWAVSGFNEKLLAKRYKLPNDPVYFQKFKEYLLDKNFRVILLMRKNFLAQAVSMIHAIKLSSSPACGSHGWSRVDQKGWEDVCGETLRQIHQEPIELNDLKFNLDDIRMKTREILKTVNRLDIPRLTVYYEDLEISPAKVLRSISYWIGLNSSLLLRPHQTIFIKQGFNNLTQLPNYEQIRIFLSKYSPCLLRTVDESMKPRGDVSICL